MYTPHIHWRVRALTAGSCTFPGKCLLSGIVVIEWCAPLMHERACSLAGGVWLLPGKCLLSGIAVIEWCAPLMHERARSLAGGVGFFLASASYPASQ